MNQKMKGPGAPVQGASGTKIKAGELRVQDTKPQNESNGQVFYWSREAGSVERLTARGVLS